ncbi:b3 domain-containing transcription factor vrn1 [Fagus crenata]
MKLRIPVKFVREFGDELSTEATLTVPSGGIWQVGLEESDNHLWFCNGWKDFVEYHSICLGHLLVFRYEGNSNFHVIIMDKTTTEIQYPLEDEVEIIDVDEELPTKHEEVREKIGKKKHFGMSSKGGRERAIQAATTFKPSGPSFMSILKPYNIRFYSLYVPAEFAINFTSRDQIVTLQTPDGKKWRVQCNIHGAATTAMRMGKGFSEFVKHNNLEEGDVCVFEMIEKQPDVLSVTVFRVVDHAIN